MIVPATPGIFKAIPRGSAIHIYTIGGGGARIRNAYSVTVNAHQVEIDRRNRRSYTRLIHHSGGCVTATRPAAVKGKRQCALIFTRLVSSDRYPVVVIVVSARMRHFAVGSINGELCGISAGVVRIKQSTCIGIVQLIAKIQPFTGTNAVHGIPHGGIGHPYMHNAVALLIRLLFSKVLHRCIAGYPVIRNVRPIANTCACSLCYSNSCTRRNRTNSTERGSVTAANCQVKGGRGTDISTCVGSRAVAIPR